MVRVSTDDSDELVTLMPFFHMNSNNHQLAEYNINLS